MPLGPLLLILSLVAGLSLGELSAQIVNVSVPRDTEMIKANDNFGSDFVVNAITPPRRARSS